MINLYRHYFILTCKGMLRQQEVQVAKLLSRPFWQRLRISSAKAVSAPKDMFLPAKRKLADLFPEDGFAWLLIRDDLGWWSLSLGCRWPDSTAFESEWKTLKATCLLWSVKWCKQHGCWKAKKNKMWQEYEAKIVYILENSWSSCVVIWTTCSSHPDPRGPIPHLLFVRGEDAYSADKKNNRNKWLHLPRPNHDQQRKFERAIWLRNQTISKIKKIHKVTGYRFATICKCNDFRVPSNLKLLRMEPVILPGSSFCLARHIPNGCCWSWRRWSESFILIDLIDHVSNLC